MTNRDILDELRVRGELVERLKRIAPRFREIINLRYGLSFETGLIVRGEMTLEEVGKLYSITNERVRQIERNVFKKLSEGLTDSPWHTEKPTEDGTFLVLWKDTEEPIRRYSVLHWNEYNDTWYDEETSYCNWGDEDHAEVIAWQKIEPYKGEKE